MAKFYISSGQFQKIIDRIDAETAVIDSFAFLKQETLSLITQASETGFNSENPNDCWFFTPDILEESGQLANYKEKWV